jgi:hypothetical protein
MTLLNSSFLTPLLLTSAPSLCAKQKTYYASGNTNTNRNGRRKHDEDHPTRSQMINRNIYDDYAMKPGSLKPLFIRAADLLGQMEK